MGKVKTQPSKAKDPNTGLTYGEMEFLKEYINNGYNATQAYMTVHGCTYGTANARAHQIVAKPEAKKYVAELQKGAFEEACISAERIALKLAEIAFSDKTDENYNPQAQLKALDLLQKQLSLQNQKITADVDSKISITVGIDSEE